ncbi:hypothetical protein BEST7613_1537 [Synechocystis sp. PCC 6803]|nr:hypothetical protein BEST7613_1537 [Synechocystis sp. PCC 6803] [Bacillus subtilis BEST7613]
MKQHILVLEDANQRRTIILDEQQYSIGRHSGTSIQIHSRQASRHHATLMRKTNSKTNEECFWIIDGDLEGNKSQNGVFVNGEKRLIHELKNGDLINFGCSINASYHVTGEGFGESSSQPVEILPQTSPYNEAVSAQIASSYNTREGVDLLAGSNDETFHEQSYLDTATDLPNQTLFLEYLNIALSNARRHHAQVGVLLCQINNWSDLKRKRGDAVANAFLQEAGQKLKSNLRNGDIVSRWDKDEFIFLVSKVQDTSSLLGIAQRLMKPVLAPVTAGGRPFQPEITYGVALYPVDGEQVNDLIGHIRENLQQLLPQPTNPGSGEADDHIETAVDVRIGAPQPVPGLSDSDQKRLAIVEKRLLRALEQHELELYYQPRINWRKKTIEAMEAFIRWQHPQKGLLPPGQFLPWSDQTEFMVPLTRWILETACQQNVLWQQQLQTPFLVSVNISEKQFYHPLLKNMVMEAIAMAKMETHYLELEIQESTVMKDFGLAQQIITNLHNYGVGFSLDDFGTDYMSPRCLQDLPFQKLKIDKSLTAQLLEQTDNVPNLTMMETLINLGKTFNLKVVAEGVEQEEQINILDSLNCFFMQGYCFSEPLNILAANSFLHKYIAGN